MKLAAGIVDQTIEAAVQGKHALDHRRHLHLAADVAAERVDRIPLALDLVRDARELFRVAARDHEPRAERG